MEGQDPNKSPKKGKNLRGENEKAESKHLRAKRRQGRCAKAVDPKPVKGSREAKKEKNFPLVTMGPKKSGGLSTPKAGKKGKTIRGGAKKRKGVIVFAKS